MHTVTYFLKKKKKKLNREISKRNRTKFENWKNKISRKSMDTKKNRGREKKELYINYILDRLLLLFFFFIAIMGATDEAYLSPR